jgi:hypothetical protein
MVTANNFRDGKVSSISIDYDWEAASGFAVIRIDQGGIFRKYKITGLTEFSLFEDFSSACIEQCTLVNEKGRVYLCLDPYLENKPTGKDGCYFRGASIVLLN